MRRDATRAPSALGLLRSRMLKAQRRMLVWFDARQRPLPWRGGDPYRVWLSEIMLQQTRVEAVIPHYERFLDRFPSIDVLAEATLEEVLQAWSGLGYYRRARMLHEAAGRVAEAGCFPRGREAWRELPGIGDYTSAALASIVDGEAAPVVDGNVERVAARFLRHDAAKGTSALKRAAAVLADTLLDPDRPGDSNQALMELGATVCKPRAADCSACPLQEDCASNGLEDRHEFPRAPTRRKPIELPLLLLLAEKDGRVLLWRRDSGWNPGLHEPPSLPGHDRDAAQRIWTETWQQPGIIGERIGEIRHTITHHRIRAALHRLERWGGEGGKHPAQVALTALARKTLSAPCSSLFSTLSS